MAIRELVKQLETQRRSDSLGGKASGLRRLASMGYGVPPTWVCSWRVGRRCLANHRRTLAELRRELDGLVDPAETYAVRSSANVEDRANASFAGLFESAVHLQGASAVFEGMLQVWRSAENPRVQAMTGGRTSAQPIRLSVLIQPMVAAVCSGIAFSRNPITGYEEIVVEATEGTSERLTQGLVTPHHWVFSQDMLSEACDSSLPALPPEVLGRVASETQTMAQEIGFPLDLEWAYDGTRLYWLQMRPITSLGSLAIYSNKMSREFLPGLIKPMVWSINVPMINGAWLRLFEEIVGSLDMDPKTLAKQFSYRAYFNMSGMGRLLEKLGLPSNTLEILLGLAPSDTGRSPIRFNLKLLRYLPRAVRFLLHARRFSRYVERWIPDISASLSGLEKEIQRLETSRDLQVFVDKLLPFLQDMAYVRILTQLLHFIMTRRAEKRLAKWNWPHPLASVENHDPRVAALGPSQGLRELMRLLDQAEARDEARNLDFEEFMNRYGEGPFSEAFTRFMRRFGSVSDSGNDFSCEPWRENPAKVLAMVASQSQELPSHEEPQADAAQERWIRARLRFCIQRRVDRDRVSAVFSRGLGLLRDALMKIAKEWVDKGWITCPDDIFYLEWEDVGRVQKGRHDGGVPVAETIAVRRDDMDACANIQLPEMILGDQPPQVSMSGSLPGVLRGIPASKGTYEGRVCVLHSTDEAARLERGDVLVIPHSDVGWVPLFSRAGALVAEAGGTLSHASILARELHIPAVVSVYGACGLTNGTRVVVHGDAGTVTVSEGVSNDGSRGSGDE